MNVLMIDNYDSFTYNLVQYLGELGADVEVLRNDQASIADIIENKASHIVISPGPGTPERAGISMAVIRELSGAKPILGVCLGHQSIAQVYGGNIMHARHIMHGKVSVIRHYGQGVFNGLQHPFKAMRYHSLVIDKNSLPDCLEITAWTENTDGSMDAVMGVRHRTLKTEGVQFHPESIQTEHGYHLLKNFLNQ